MKSERSEEGGVHPGMVGMACEGMLELESREGTVCWTEEAPSRVLEPQWGEEATHGVDEAVVATGEWLVIHRGTTKNHGAGFSLSEKGSTNTERKPERMLWC